MTFANPLPVWLLLPAAAACAAVAWYAYRPSLLSPRQRIALSTLRFTALAWLIVCLMRPVAGAPAGNADAILPVLIDASRSMSLPGADGLPRLEEARRIASALAQPSPGSPFRRDLLAFGDSVTSADVARLTPSESRTRIADALHAVRERYRGQPVAGIILLSDGADNGNQDVERAVEGGPPVFAIGIGPRSSPRDREVLGVTTAETVLDAASADVTATAVAHGYGTTPIELRLLENGRPIDVRSVTPASDGAPVSTVFTVSPSRDRPTVYTVEIPPARDELSVDNNARGALVPAARPPLRVLLAQGAPGFEHAFLRRAWTADAAIQLDSVVRKGKDDRGGDTFYVQANATRAQALLGGWPAARDALFAYDVVVLANVDADELTEAEMESLRAFVAERGGGLLVLGARGFQRHGLRGTPLETVLPLDLGDRATDAVPASTGAPAMNRVSLTAAGEAHPIMQIGSSPDDTRKRWEAIPPLAAVSPLGAARPGSAVLAVTAGPGGVSRALVAVQRVGEGRAMVFTGEASWRWRMMLPASDRTYDRFWRQALRWLGQTAPGPVSLTLPQSASPGQVAIAVTARDAAYVPQADAVADVRAIAPNGTTTSLRAEPVAGQPGHFQTTFRASEAGVYQVIVDARRGGNAIGTVSGSLLVGGADPEFTDPRLDTATLSRIARASGGSVIAPRELSSVIDRLRISTPVTARSERQDLWGRSWSFAALFALLATEWLLRRRWGLR
jgi:uncharacterized membrane protein